jgi:hypothetical protein
MNISTNIETVKEFKTSQVIIPAWIKAILNGLSDDSTVAVTRQRVIGGSYVVNVTANKKTLAEIKAIPIQGNAHFDGGIFQDIDIFVHDTSNSMNERRAALVYMSEVMGAEIEQEETRMTDRQVVEHYISESN